MNTINTNQVRRVRIIAIPLAFTIIGFIGFNIGLIGEAEAKTTSNKDIISGLPNAKIKDFDENKYQNGIDVATQLEEKNAFENNSLTDFDANKIGSNEMLSSDEKQTLLRNNITPKSKEEILLEHSKRTSTILNDQTRAIQNIYKTQPETAEQRQAQANIQRAKELNNYALSLAQQNDLMALNGSKTNSTYVQSPSVQLSNYSDTPREPTKQQPDIKVLDEKVIASSISSKIEVEGRKLNAFYGIKGEKKEMGQSKPSANIRAVIHGDADIISVVNGSNIKIRLIQDIKINGIVVPKNTLITGTCNINGDRIYIGVSTVKIGDDLFPLRVKVVDNDGVDGIYVPNLQVKSQLNQAIARSTDAVNSPGFYSTPSNAPAGQQIIGQIAAQGVSSLIQTGKQILNQKASVAKVSIKSNHQILLIPVQF